MKHQGISARGPPCVARFAETQTSDHINYSFNSNRQGESNEDSLHQQPRRRICRLRGSH